MNFYNFGIYEALVKLGFSKEALERWQMSPDQLRKAILEDVARETRALAQRRSHPRLTSRSMSVDPLGATAIAPTPSSTWLKGEAPWELSPAERSARINAIAARLRAQLQSPAGVGTMSTVPTVGRIATPTTTAISENVTRNLRLPRAAASTGGTPGANSAVQRLKQLLRFAPKG